MLSCQQMQVCPHVVLISAQKVQFPLELAWRLCCKLYSNSEAKLAEANITHTLIKLCARVVVFFTSSCVIILGLQAVQTGVCGCYCVFNIVSTCFVQTEVKVTVAGK